MFGHEWRRQLNGTSNPQVGVVVFFSGLVLSWAKSWSSPPPPPSPAHSKGSPERLDWADVADEPDAAWDVNEEPPRARRESLWEEAEIEGLDVTERAERWEPGMERVARELLDGKEDRLKAVSEALTGMGRASGFSNSFRRGSAFSLLHHLLGADTGQHDIVSARDSDSDSPDSPLASDGRHLAAGIGGDSSGFGLGGAGAARPEMTQRSPKAQRMHRDGPCPLLPPPSGPRK